MTEAVPHRLALRAARPEQLVLALDGYEGPIDLLLA